MLQDYKLGLRMLLKYPGLTLAGGLALAVAIGIGAGCYDLVGKIASPTIPLPEGDRLVVIETQNISTNESEPRVVRDFLEWRRELRTIEDLGAYRTDTRNLVLGNGVPELIQVAELTVAAFVTARVQPIFGRGLLDSDMMPGAPSVVVLGYDVWQRSLRGRHDVVGSVVNLGDTPATVIGVMPDGFAYPVNHDAWTPLSLRASYEALEGGAVTVVGRLAPGVSREQANAELRVIGERASAALPATHAHLRPRAIPLAGEAEDFAQFALRHLPALLVLTIACLSVGTLVYARTAIREGEIAIRSALGASRSRIIGQLFVEALVLASVPAAVGLIAADRVLTWGIESVNRAEGGAPFWVTPGLSLPTILYAGVLAVVSAAMLSFLPALKVTRARMQPHLANLGSGGATMRFGRIWTGAMIVQVALTAIGIPGALESVNQTGRKLQIRAQFPSREYLAARIDVDRPFEEETSSSFQERRAQTFAALARRITQEPGVVAVTFADRAPGSGSKTRSAGVESSAGAGLAYDDLFQTSAVGPGFFEAFDRPIVAGRAFHGGDWNPSARTVIVNEAFARAFSRESGSGSAIGARLRYRASSAQPDASSEPSTDKWFEIVGVVRDLGLDPDERGNERPFVFHAASAGTASPLVMSVRTHGNAATLAARLPVIAGTVDARLLVQDARPLDEWLRDTALIVIVGVQLGVTALVLFLSALGLFSLTSVSVSRRTREIGLRTALGASARHVLAGILFRTVVLMGSGITAGGALLLLCLALGEGPSGRPAEDVPLFVGYLGMTSVVMLAACLLACIGPARRALKINPTDALREA
jgi:predicted permease